MKKATKRLKSKVSKLLVRSGQGGGVGGGGNGGGRDGVKKTTKKRKVSSYEVAKYIRRSSVAGGKGAYAKKVTVMKKKKKKKAEEEGAGEEIENGIENGTENGSSGRFEDMDADAFIGGGFMIGMENDHATTSLDTTSEDDDEDDNEDDDEDDDDNDNDNDDEDDYDNDNDNDKENDDEEDISEETSDDEMGEENADQKNAKKITHKDQLENLKKSDPEFYKYLEEEDEDLLNFDDDEEEEEEKEIADADDFNAENRKNYDVIGREGSRTIILTVDKIEKWIKTCSSANPSIGAAAALLRAFRTACHHGDEQRDMQQSNDNLDSSNGKVVKLDGATSYNRSLIFCLKEMPTILLKLLGENPPALAMSSQKLYHDKKHNGEPSGKGDYNDDSDHKIRKSKKWRTLESLFRTFVGNAFHLLSSMTDSALLAFTLRCLRAHVKVLSPFPALCKKYLKAVLSIFGSDTSKEEDESDARCKFEAFLLLRQMAIELPDPCFERTLNGMYRTYATTAKFINQSSLPKVSFMAGCIADTFGLDQIKAYPIAFQHIRQMAIMLKTALTEKSAEAVQTIYSWQFLNCADVWTRVLSAHAATSDEDPPLRPLIYPLTQILLGVIKLVPTARYTPFRLRCISMLVSFSRNTGVYVPISPLLLSMLSMTELKSAPTGGAGRQTDWLYTIRLPKGLLRTSTFHDQTITEVCDLLTQHLSQFACHIAYPELAYTVTVALKHFAGSTPVERFRRQAKSLVSAFEENSAWVMQRRNRVDFAPKDREQVDLFEVDGRKSEKSPLMKFSKERMKARDRRAASAQTSDKEMSRLNDDDGENDRPRRKEKRLKPEKVDKAEKPNDMRKKKVLQKVSDIGKRGIGSSNDYDADNMQTEDVITDLILSDDEEEINYDELNFEEHLVGGTR